MMRFGLAFASSVGIDGRSSIDLCRSAEAVGFESVWGGEHVIMPSSIESKYPYTRDGKVPAQPETYIPDPLIWLAYVAAAAPTLRLGTCILIVPQRNPLVLAKELATLDHLTGGRVELGLGVGWLQEEFTALGVPWERRGARNDEYVEAMRALWAGPHAEYHGEFVDFAPVTCSPRPIQQSIPILVGGDTPVALRRAVRYADGYFPGEGDIHQLRQLIAELRTMAEQHGRDPDSIEINAMYGSLGHDIAERVEELADAGVARVMVPAFGFGGPEGVDRFESFGRTAVTAAARIAS